MAWQPGDMVGTSYKIEKQLGSGGMATVYKAYHEKLDRHVAIKVMHQALLEDTNFHERFSREARIIAKLEHPNIVSVFDYNEHEKQPYLVMKYIDGRTLKHVLKDGPMPLNEVLRVMKTIANALDYAHQRGVLHRDIKPSNIIIDTRGIPYLTDFGLARIAQSGESTMSADMMLGTPFYISPEQAQGNRDIDSRADVYSLGVVLYELVVGRVPFAADTPYATVHNHIFMLPPAPRELNPAVSEDVELVLLKALAKEPDYRYQSAGELIRAFEQALTASEVAQLDVNRQRADYSIIEELSPSVQQPAEQVRRNVPQADESGKPKRHVPGAGVPEPPQPPKNASERLEQWGERVEKDIEAWGERFGQNAEAWNEEIGQRIETFLEETLGGKKEQGEGDSKKKRKKDADLTPEERIRKRIKKRADERNGLVIHMVIYFVMSVFFISLWEFDGFAWPFIPIFFWGIGVFSHFMSYWNEHGPGYERQERMIQAELEREQRRQQGLSGAYEKPKNDEVFERLRLNEEGEFTESFIEELDEEERRKRR